MLGEFTGEHEADGGLDLAGAEGAALVGEGKTLGLVDDAVEDVNNHGLHNLEGAGVDASAGVDLSEDLADVQVVGRVVGGLGAAG